MTCMRAGRGKNARMASVGPWDGTTSMILHAYLAPSAQRAARKARRALSRWFLALCGCLRLPRARFLCGFCVCRVSAIFTYYYTAEGKDASLPPWDPDSGYSPFPLPFSQRISLPRARCAFMPLFLYLPVFPDRDFAWHGVARTVTDNDRRLWHMGFGFDSGSWGVGGQGQGQTTGTWATDTCRF